MTEDFDPEKAMQALRSIGVSAEEFAEGMKKVVDALAEYQNRLWGLK